MTSNGSGGHRATGVAPTLDADGIGVGDVDVGHPVGRARVLLWPESGHRPFSEMGDGVAARLRRSGLDVPPEQPAVEPRRLDRIARTEIDP